MICCKNNNFLFPNLLPFTLNKTERFSLNSTADPSGCWLCSKNTEPNAVFAKLPAWCCTLLLVGMSGVISKVVIKCAWLSYSFTFRDKKTSVTDEGPTLHHHPSLFGHFSFCHRAPAAKWVWHQLRTKLEIAGWESKAFTDPLKICKRKPSNGVICKKIKQEMRINIIHYSPYLYQLLFMRTS